MEFLPILQYNSTSVQLQYNKKTVANQGICCNTCHTLMTKSISTDFSGIYAALYIMDCFIAGHHKSVHNFQY